MVRVHSKVTCFCGVDIFILFKRGGTTGFEESLLYTVDIKYGWGDACDKKAMHGCPLIKKAFVMKTFTCPTTSGVLVEVTTSAMDYDSCKKDRGNGCGSNETPTKGVDGNPHGSSIREPLSGR
nr:hypothetical protein [Tanacetum cinerariifolium]